VENKLCAGRLLLLRSSKNGYGNTRCEGTVDVAYTTMHEVALGAYINAIRSGTFGPLTMCANAARNAYTLRTP
jgi:hypothetical protein